MRFFDNLVNHMCDIDVENTSTVGVYENKGIWAPLFLRISKDDTILYAYGQSSVDILRYSANRPNCFSYSP